MKTTRITLFVAASLAAACTSTERSTHSEQLVAHDDGTAELSFEHEGNTYVFSLKPSRIVRSDLMVTWVSGGAKRLVAPSGQYYRGQRTDDPASWIRLHVDGDNWHGSVSLGGDLLHVQREHERFRVEPHTYDDDHGCELVGDAISSDASDSARSPLGEMLKRRAAPTNSPRDSVLIDLALVSDYEFVSHLGRPNRGPHVVDHQPGAGNLRRGVWLAFLLGARDCA